VLIVFFNSRISPFTSTVISVEVAIVDAAVATFAMFAPAREVLRHRSSRCLSILPRASHAADFRLAASLPSVPTSAPRG